jgi:chemotaxis protein MotB
MKSQGGLEGSNDPQDYMVTVGDLMAGLVFLFILTLMIFAFRFQTATEAIQSASETRTVILRELEARLREEDILVVIDTLQGVLRLSDSDGNIGFEFGRETVFPEHVPKVAILTRILSDVVPCFSVGGPLACRVEDVDPIRHASRIHAIQIEGHTDSIPFSARTNSRFISNLELSAARAANIHGLMLGFEPGMGGLMNADGTPVLGIAGYGAERRLMHLPGDDARQRRIDLRFIMEPPRGRLPVPVVEVEAGLRDSRAP